MVLLKSCCLCFSPRTGTVVLGCLGILAAVLAMVPHVLVLQHHQFYINEFIKQQRSMEARDIRDEDIPAITYFSRMTWSLMVAFDVVFTFASILLIAGVAAEKRHLLVPWMVITSLTIVFNLIMVLAGMFSVANSFAVVIFLIAAPFLITGLYFWLTVYSTFHQMRKDTVPSGQPPISSSCAAAQDLGRNGGGRQHLYKSLPDSRHMVLMEQPSFATTVVSEEAKGTTPVTRSASLASLTSASAAALASRLGSLGATPPPPYEAVALDIGKEAEALAAGIGQDALTFSKNQRRSRSADDLEVEATRSTEAMRRSASNISKMSFPLIVVDAETGVVNDTTEENAMIDPEVAAMEGLEEERISVA